MEIEQEIAGVEGSTLRKYRSMQVYISYAGKKKKEAPEKVKTKKK